MALISKQGPLSSYTLEYPDNLKRGSLIIYYSGINTTEWSNKNGIIKETPSKIKDRAFMLYVNHKADISLVDLINWAKSNIEPETDFVDIKLLGFSGGGEDIIRQLSSPGIDKISFIGLVDPSFGKTQVLLDNLKKFSRKKIIKMIWGFVWSGDLEARRIEGAKILSDAGASVIKDINNETRMDPGHRKYIKLFYETYENELIGTIIWKSNTNILQPTASVQPADQPPQLRPPSPPELPVTNTLLNQKQISDSSSGIVSSFGDDKNIYDRIDTSFSVIDSSTTVDGLIKMIAEEHIFKEDVYKNIEEFVGQVYKITVSADMNTSYKVRVPGLHSLLPIPKNYGDSADDKSKKIIDIYPNFTIKKQQNNLFSVAVGDLVRVTFEDINNFTGGKIISTISTNSNGLGTSKPVEQTEKPPTQEKFKEQPQQITDTQPDIREKTQTIFKDDNFFDTDEQQRSWAIKVFKRIKKNKQIIGEIQEAILLASQTIGIDQKIIKAFIATESGYDPEKVNKISGASGLMQLMPGTAYDYSKKKLFLNTFNTRDYKINNIKHNVFLGTLLLKDLEKMYFSDLERMAGGYNNGQYRKDSDGQLLYAKPNFKERLKEIVKTKPGLQETISYIKRITTLYQLFTEDPNAGIA